MDRLNWKLVNYDGPEGETPLPVPAFAALRLQRDQTALYCWRELVRSTAKSPVSTGSAIEQGALQRAYSTVLARCIEGRVRHFWMDRAGEALEDPELAPYFNR